MEQLGLYVDLSSIRGFLYSDHERAHVIKYKSVVARNRLIENLFYPWMVEDVTVSYSKNLDYFKVYISTLMANMIEIFVWWYNLPFLAQLNGNF